MCCCGVAALQAVALRVAATLWHCSSRGCGAAHDCNVVALRVTATLWCCT